MGALKQAFLLFTAIAVGTSAAYGVDLAIDKYFCNRKANQLADDIIKNRDPFGEDV